MPFGLISKAEFPKAAKTLPANTVRIQPKNMKIEATMYCALPVFPVIAACAFSILSVAPLTAASPFGEIGSESRESRAAYFAATPWGAYPPATAYAAGGVYQPAAGYTGAPNLPLTAYAPGRYPLPTPYAGTAYSPISPYAGVYPPASAYARRVVRPLSAYTGPIYAYSPLAAYPGGTYGLVTAYGAGVYPPPTAYARRVYRPLPVYTAGFYQPLTASQAPTSYASSIYSPAPSYAGGSLANYPYYGARNWGLPY